MQLTSAERQLAHARVVQARGAALPSEGLPDEAILDSWARCMAGGLRMADAVTVPVVEAADLARRRHRSAVVRQLAQAELETLAQQIAGSNFLLAFADQDGVILDLYADNRFAMSDGGAPIVTGSLWTEAQAGTNGLGTALATGHAVAVTGLEHYFLRLGEVSCTAAPVRDAQGEVVGVLDASSYFESRQRHTLALVQMAATHIENGLLQHQMRHCHVLAVHPRAEFLGTLSAGLLALDDDGRLLAVNARGRQLLQGLAATPGALFEQLFGEPFGPVLSRLRRGADLRLHDLMGSALVVRCIGRPALPLRPLVPALSVADSVAEPPTTTARAMPQVPAEPQAGAAAGGSTDPRAPRTLGAPLTAWALSPLTLPPSRPDRAVERPASTHPAGQVLDDPAVQAAYRLVDAAVRLRVPILIHGETGSGKEALARHAHQASGRRGAFVAVNCGALPAELFEAELFGYVGGAFTGARREGSPGLIASADGGTLLLDEVRELPAPLQAALLRFLDDQQVRPVGGSTARQVDVQLLAASHGALDDEVAARRFRADLLYRLNTVRVDLPPLRARSDFALAARTLLASIDPGARIDEPALQCLRQHAWPGNFRELRGVLTRALLAGDGRHLRLADVAAQLPALADGTLAPPASALQQGASALVRREFERTGGSVSQTSRNLGISRTTVYRHLRASGLAGAGRGEAAR